jgi:hypothetical protein
LQVTAVAGGFQVTITSSVAIPAGTRQLLNVIGSMNAQALAGTAGMLRIDDVLVNGAAAPEAADAAVVYVGATGDMDRNGAYDANDVTKLQRLVVKLDTFLGGADDIDATVIGDVDADGVLTSRDVAYVQARTRAASTSMIPALAAQPATTAAAQSTLMQAPVSAMTAPAPASGSGAATLNLTGKLANFSLKPAAPAQSAAVASASLEVALKVAVSTKSDGVAA